MGKKAKSSRKGKKAWRANISTEDIEEYFEKSTKDALSGGSLADAPSDSLFYVDKSRGKTPFPSFFIREKTHNQAVGFLLFLKNGFFLLVGF